jgi:hypothetical protein
LVHNQIKISILAFLLMLPMLSFGEPLQLTVFYNLTQELLPHRCVLLRNQRPLAVSLQEDLGLAETASLDLS